MSSFLLSALQYSTARLKLNFSVATGILGNVFAGWTTALMGLAIDKILVCSNANDIITRFFETGEMKKCGIKQTVTPSMDIEVSSNFERYLFELFDRNSDQVTTLMNELQQTGAFKVNDEHLEKSQSHFRAGRVSDAETCETIVSHYRATGAIIDPHSAVALTAVNRLGNQLDAPTVVVATAHPAKFPETIKRTLDVQVPMPKPHSAIAQLPERYRRISSDPEELKTLMLQS